MVMGCLVRHANVLSLPPNNQRSSGFQQIKDSLIEKVGLYLLRRGARWRLSTDATDFAVAGVLEQEQGDGNWHPSLFFLESFRAVKQLVSIRIKV